MPRRHLGTGLRLLACALLAGGCSAASGDRHASRHAAGIHLAPDPAYAASRVTVVFDDAWVDPATCAYEWRRNGKIISDAATNTLEPATFSRGDQITVVVGLPDSAGSPIRTLRAETRVDNSPPRVLRASLVLSTTSGRAEIQATAECIDPDGGQPALTYRWFRNGAPVEGASGATVPAASFTRSDRVEVEVVANDGESKSAPRRSEPLSLDNHPPQFTSQPEPPGPVDLTFRYQAVASDPDGDPLRYELAHGPLGMTVDPSGAVYWALPTGPLRTGEFPVGIKATDSAGGEATQEFTLKLAPADAKR